MVHIRRLTSIAKKQFQELCDLLIDSVEGGASVGFLSPMTEEKAAPYWHGVETHLASGLGLFVAEENGAIVGAVQLIPSQKENSRHRADLVKLFVLSTHRGRGIATLLMQEAEAYALSVGCSLLMLDTHAGCNAEPVYQHLGWTKYGVVPGYSASTDGTLHDTAFYYKHLNGSSSE